MNDQAMAVNRVFVAIATEKNAEPGTPEFDGKWVTHKDNKAALEPIEHMLRIPNNAILVSNIQEGMTLLNMVKEKLMPNMSSKSGLQICVVHTEAILSPDPAESNLQATVLLFPVGYLTMEAMSMEQNLEQNFEVKVAPETATDSVAVEEESTATESVAPTEQKATFTVIQGGKE